MDNISLIVLFGTLIYFLIWLQKKQALSKIKERVSDEMYAYEYLLAHPGIPSELIIEARKEIAHIFAIPAEVITMNTRLNDLKNILSESEYGLALGDIYDDIYDGLKGTDLDPSLPSNQNIERVDELLLMYIKAQVEIKKQNKKYSA